MDLAQRAAAALTLPLPVPLALPLPLTVPTTLFRYVDLAQRLAWTLSIRHVLLATEDQNDLRHARPTLDPHLNPNPEA